VLKKAIGDASKEYKDKVGKDIQVEIDEANPQPEGR
jgi:V-type H+-transporting ATPase subunit E